MEMEIRVAGGVGDAKSGSELALGFLIILLKQGFKSLQLKSLK
jgi:hypothetical protein